jgi:hypothetical protein
LKKKKKIRRQRDRERDKQCQKTLSPGFEKSYSLTKKKTNEFINWNAKASIIKLPNHPNTSDIKSDIKPVWTPDLINNNLICLKNIKKNQK